MKYVTCYPDEALALGHAAASLLNQLRYWRDKAKGGKSRYVVERAGYRWIARSRAQLASEVGLSERQLDRAMQRLRDVGMIVSERHLFDNKVVAHIRLTDDADISYAKCGHSDFAIIGENYIYENYEENINENSAGAGSAAGSDEFSEKEKEKGSDAPAGTDGLGELISGFQSAWADCFPDQYLAPFTQKDRAQLRQFAAKCPTGEAGQVLDHAVRNWNAFTSRAKWLQNAFSSPYLPQISFLLTYAQSAVQLLLDTKAPQATSKFVKAPIKPGPGPVPPKPSELAPEDKFPTIEEVAKLMGYSDDA